MELEREVVRGYAETFINRWDMYSVQRPNGRYYSVKKRLDMELVALHLQGVPTLGAYALDPQSQAKWICFDADDGIEWRRLQDMAAELARASVAAYLEPSRRGGHLWLFTPQIDGSVARRFAQQLMVEHNVAVEEVFPKQARLKTGPGSFVRLPLGVHRKTGKRYYFVDLEGQPIAPTVREQIALLASPTLVSRAYIDEVLDRVKETSKPDPRPLQCTITPDASLPLTAQIKQAVSVYDFVVFEYGLDLDEKGLGYCPFHDDEHPSFQVDRERNYWHCYAGCKGQTVIDFELRWRERHGLETDWNEVLHDLAVRVL